MASGSSRRTPRTCADLSRTGLPEDSAGGVGEAGTRAGEGSPGNSPVASGGGAIAHIKLIGCMGRLKCTPSETLSVTPVTCRPSCPPGGGCTIGDRGSRRPAAHPPPWHRRRPRAPVLRHPVAGPSSRAAAPASASRRSRPQTAHRPVRWRVPTAAARWARSRARVAWRGRAAGGPWMPTRGPGTAARATPSARGGSGSSAGGRAAVADSGTGHLPGARGAATPGPAA